MSEILDVNSIKRAAQLLSDVVKRTSLDHSSRLTNKFGVDVLLKREDVQLARSYKIRGAYNFISSLSDQERAMGVVCASAGNHAQGVAYSCNKLGIKGKIFLPATTPRQKRQKIMEFGGLWVEIVIGGHSYDDASLAARRDEIRSGSVFVHAFDDPRTIAGQATVGVELLEQLPTPNVSTVVVPVGGGGLIAGIALWLRSQRPDITIIGAEPTGAPSMTKALANNGPIALEQMDSFVDGAAVGRVGDLTFPIVRDLVDEIVLVPEGAICTEMLELYQNEGIITEPAGALATAALSRIAIDRSKGAVVAILSGGNNDVSRYSEILERSLVHEGLRHYFLVTFPQEPGSLRRFLEEVLSDGEDIVVFEYVKKSNRETGPALVGIDLESPDSLSGLLWRMQNSPLEIEQVPPGSPLFTFLL
ncbi:MULTISPECIES: threonine ammonia-lyase IlvA [Acidithrix]|uniref:L-threonine dehydratase n=2 Tax=Acidithrix ferrooxidans TaxID=1280514 RepID=A0A0D8HHL8_9ACTN|nr:MULTISPECIES: threonine ammonia-lyase IlvA [Acidithrix]KJF17408.1 L-threonine dehydratase biosynthetic IlvA [Acidithrix ferrooxidans]CAG4913132.1 unnamed protein product [Acidithrix sp. C25]